MTKPPFSRAAPRIRAITGNRKRRAIHSLTLVRKQRPQRKPHCDRQREAAPDSASSLALSHSPRSMPICTASI